MRLIDADRLKRQVEGRSWRAKEKFIELIDASATIKSDTVLLHYGVKHGRWIVVSDGYGNGDATAHICECSECKDTIWVYKNATRRWNYCPNCGARMDLKEEAETEYEP